MFHKHKFIKISENTLPSPFEQITQSKCNYNGNIKDIGYFKKKLIIILQCEQCGKLKTISESN